MTKKWLIAFFAPLCLLALGVPVLHAQKAITSTTIPGNTKSDKSAKPDKPIKADKAEKKPLQPPQDETAHPRPERQDEDRSMWSRAKQAIPSPFPALEKKAQKNTEIGDAKRGDRAARIDELKDQLASKNHPDPKAAQAELDNLRKQRSIGEKLEASSLYKLGEKQKTKAQSKTDREDAIFQLKAQIKSKDTSPEERKSAQKELDELRKQRTLNEKIESTSLYGKAEQQKRLEEQINQTKEKLKGPISRAEKAQLEDKLDELRKDRTLSSKITKYSTSAQTPLQVGGAALIAGGVLAAGGALAVGMGGVAAAKKEALNPLAETLDPSTSAQSEGAPQSGEGMFIPSSFAQPAE